MVSTQGTIPLYGPLSDTDDKGGGGNVDQTDWKAKYEALNSQIAAGQYVTQASYITLQKNLEAAVNERKLKDGDLGTAQARIALLTEAEGSLKTTIATLEANEVKLKSDVGIRDTKLERHNVIFKDFPGLAPFEADGLLPVPQGDQKLTDLLTSFQTKIAGLTDKAKTDFQKTSTEPIPPKAIDDKAKESGALLREANALLGQGKVAEYNVKMEAYQVQKTKEHTTQ